MEIVKTILDIEVTFVLKIYDWFNKIMNGLNWR